MQAGTYTLTVYAYTSDEAKQADKPEARGELPSPVTITAGQNTSAEVVLYAIEEGTGVFYWNITLPSELEEAYLQITPKDDTAGSTPPFTMYFIGGSEQTANPGEVELQAGCYSVILTMVKTDTQTAVWRETLQVYQNLVSHFEHDFTAYNFVDLPQDPNDPNDPDPSGTTGKDIITITFSQLLSDDEALPWDMLITSLAVPHTVGDSITIKLEHYTQYSAIDWYMDGIFKTDDWRYVLGVCRALPNPMEKNVLFAHFLLYKLKRSPIIKEFCGS